MSVQRPSTIAVEEHLILPGDDQAALWRATVPMIPEAGIATIRPTLTDVGDRRKQAMFEAGIDRVILSNVGSVQLINDSEIALRMAREANDYLAEVVRADPERYDAFATIAVQNPVAGARELERAVQQLGLKGAMLFGTTHGRYLDDRSFDPFWDAAERLHVPIYLHAASAPALPASYVGAEILDGALWAWTAETATHFLRLLFTGVFDRHPGARVILGHMGETLPYLAARFDARSRGMSWPDRDGRVPSDYLRDHLLVTSSGVFADPPLRCAIETLGLSNVMFSLDYPFESGQEARTWFEGSSMSDEEALAVGRENAETIFYRTGAP